MSKQKISAETKLMIVEDYKNGLTTVEIGDKYGIAYTSVSYYAKRAGVPLRQQRGKKKDAKTCPRCKRPIELDGARFCPYCGNDIRNENEKLAEELDKLTRLYQYIPENERDGYIQTINKAAQKLKAAKE